MHERRKLFLERIEEELILRNIYFHLSKKEAVRSHKKGLWVAGFFQGHTEPELAVATKKTEDQWFPVLVHEYAHYTQWIEKSPEWVAYTSLNEQEDPLTLWLDKEKEMTPEELDHLFKVLIALEKDAEERTINLMKSEDLQVDLPTYIKGARAYLLFYQFVRKHRRWYKPGNEPYKTPQIYNHMPEHLNDLVLDEQTEQLFLTYL